MRPHLRYDLTFGHFVLGLHPCDPSTELHSQKALMQFSLGLAGTEDEQALAASNRRDDGAIVDV